MNIGENLKDKKIILTGGSRGIGLSMLEKLYSFQSKVLIISIVKEVVNYVMVQLVQTAVWGGNLLKKNV